MVIPHPASRAAGALVVIGGLPGAGKTTLLRRLGSGAASGIRTLDAEDVARDVAAALARAGATVPYPLLRPAVHAGHLGRVVVASCRSTRIVVATDPLTDPARLLLFRLVARLTGRPLHVLLVDATVDEALAGQSARGRRLGARRMTRHVRRWERQRRRVAETGRLADEASLVVVPRPRTPRPRDSGGRHPVAAHHGAAVLRGDPVQEDPAAPLDHRDGRHVVVVAGQQRL